MQVLAAITSDIDTLNSIYKGYDCRRPGGYTYAELHMGLENFSRFLEPFQIKTTLFMVGDDFRHAKNLPYIKAIVGEGHEIANHTLSHAQSFRVLTPEAKEAEISGMEEICLQATGRRPVGFRSPGWNISDDALPILKRRGYLYDSSIHPTSLMPLLKFLHWWTMSSRSEEDRTTMGRLSYMFSPAQPYRTTDKKLGQRGKNGLVEFPLTVVPIVRLPFFATFLLATGLQFFKTCYRLVRVLRWPIQYSFHLSDFVDYLHPELRDQVPRGRGVYVPQALRTPLKKKWDLFERALGMMAEDYEFDTLERWAKRIT